MHTNTLKLVYIYNEHLHVLVNYVATCGENYTTIRYYKSVRTNM
jgi:hypothetical protein